MTWLDRLYIGITGIGLGIIYTAGWWALVKVNPDMKFIIAFVSAANAGSILLIALLWGKVILPVRRVILLSSLMACVFVQVAGLYRAWLTFSV